MQNLEKQVGQIFKMLEKTEDRQIKGECQLIDLAKVVPRNLMSMRKIDVKGMQ